MTLCEISGQESQKGGENAPCEPLVGSMSSDPRQMNLITCIKHTKIDLSGQNKIFEAFWGFSDQNDPL